MKAEWQAEKAKQFTLIVNRAQKIQVRAAGMVERQEQKLARHDKAKPVEPSGLFAGFKKATHEQAVAAWGGVRAQLQKRWKQLEKRFRLVGEYMRKNTAYEPGLSKGELLAEKKAAKARPDLAITFRQVVAKEQSASLEALQAKTAQRQQAQCDRSKGPDNGRGRQEKTHDRSSQ